MPRGIQYALAAALLVPWTLVNIIISPVWVLIVAVGLLIRAIDLKDVPKILLVLCTGFYAWGPNPVDM